MYIKTLKNKNGRRKFRLVFDSANECAELLRIAKRNVSLYENGEKHLTHFVKQLEKNCKKQEDVENNKIYLNIYDETVAQIILALINNQYFVSETEKLLDDKIALLESFKKYFRAQAKEIEELHQAENERFETLDLISCMIEARDYIIEEQRKDINIKESRLKEYIEKMNKEEEENRNAVIDFD